jgi:hypothetical protein
MSNDFIESAVEQVEGNGDVHQECELWPEPQSVDMELLTVQSLPFEILPEPLRLWIEDVAHRMQCPPDYVASAALTLSASLIGTKCGIHPKQYDDWLVIPNLWGGVVGPPSTLKTPAINEGLRPSARLEIDAKEKCDEELRQYEVDLLESQAKRDSLKHEMKNSAKGKGKSRSMDTIKGELLELEDPKEPMMIRRKTNDATIEKLAELCNENPTGLLMVRDELVGLLASWDKPGRESDRAFFLEAWNGDGSHISDRIGRGSTFTEHLCLSVFGGIQPTKLTSYLHKSMNGLENDGLLQRFQLLVYPDEVKDWKLIDQAPDSDARERAYNVIEKLAHMDFKEYGTTQKEHDRFPYLCFTDDAQQLFNEWLTDLETKKLRANDHPMLLEHFGKFRSLMPSLALIIHLIDVADGATGGPVSLQATEKAAAFCEYLESHARRIYGLVSDIDQQAAAILAEKILAKKLTDGFTIRDIYRKNWHLLNNKELAQAACGELLELEWLKKDITPPAFAQKEKVEYRINPKVFPDNSQKEH